MIELTNFQYKVLSFLAEFDEHEIAVYAPWPTDQFNELYALREEGLLVQTLETQGLFVITGQGKLMFENAEIRRAN
jgi:hypothetical protein